jgi:hypothetical protein
MSVANLIMQTGRWDDYILPIMSGVDNELYSFLCILTSLGNYDCFCVKKSHVGTDLMSKVGIDVESVGFTDYRVVYIRLLNSMQMFSDSSYPDYYNPHATVDDVTFRWFRDYIVDRYTLAWKYYNTTKNDPDHVLEDKCLFSQRFPHIEEMYKKLFNPHGKYVNDFEEFFCLPGIVYAIHRYTTNPNTHNGVRMSSDIEILDTIANSLWYPVRDDVFEFDDKEVLRRS